jgi:peptidoglycan/LPS O-acetylase OafA/YrhL
MTSTVERAPEVSTGRRAARPDQDKFRPDIEGMRAFAVLTVVLYHANVAHVTGGYIGVDVFFVISGFLITRLLMESIGKHGVRALPTFYTRRIRRLLPASMTVVVATLVAARLWAPPLSVKSISVDGIFTTFYGLNYRLAVEGTQYLNQGNTPSPLQHYWSLGVEEQFYLCWPVLIALVAFLGGRYRKALLAVLLAGVVALSFDLSLTVTRHDAPWAYFSLSTRAWELALGALVAVASTRLAAMPAWLASTGAWLALATVIASAFLFNDSTPYPGSAAALPVVAAAVLIACGCRQRRSIDTMLRVRPLQYLGRVSYSWYLWHWPMLVIVPMIVGHALNWPERVGVVLLSLAVATASFLVIEHPARSLALPNAQWFAGGAALSAVSVVVALVILGNLPSMTGRGRPVQLVQSDNASTQVTRQMEQAVKAGLDTMVAPSNLDPPPALAHNDVPQSSNDGCHASYLQINQGPCVYGDPTGRYTVVLFGDSHMQQWLPAFASAGSYAHWRVVSWTKSACPPAELTVFNPILKRNYTECNTWRALTIRRIAALKPAVVVVTGSENEFTGSMPSAEFARATVATLLDLQRTSGAKVVYLEDTPYPGYSVPGCVVEHLGDVKSCDFPMDRAYTYPARHRATAQAVASASTLKIVDPSEWICANGSCPAVVGNLLVYRDQSHISVEFSRWLTPMVVAFLDQLQRGSGRS